MADQRKPDHFGNTTLPGPAPSLAAPDGTAISFGPHPFNLGGIEHAASWQYGYSGATAESGTLAGNAAIRLAATETEADAQAALAREEAVQAESNERATAAASRAKQDAMLAAEKSVADSKSAADAAAATAAQQRARAAMAAAAKAAGK